MLFPFLSADFVVKEEEGGRLQGLLVEEGARLVTRREKTDSGCLEMNSRGDQLKPDERWNVYVLNFTCGEKRGEWIFFSFLLLSRFLTPIMTAAQFSSRALRYKISISGPVLVSTPLLEEILYQRCLSLHLPQQKRPERSTRKKNPSPPPPPIIFLDEGAYLAAKKG